MNSYRPTVAESAAAFDKSPGWVAHSSQSQGYPAPLKATTRVMVRFRGGSVATGTADTWRSCWRTDGSLGDIVAYKRMGAGVAYGDEIGAPDQWDIENER